jgi:hypothetical protein
LKIKNNRLKEVNGVIVDLASTRNPMHRIHLARILTKMKARIDDYDFAVKASPEFLQYEDKRRGIQTKYGEVQVAPSGQVQVVVKPENRNAFETEMADMKIKYAEAIAEEADRAALVRKVGEEEVEIPIEAGVVKASWLGDFIDGRSLAILMEFELISDQELEKALLVEQRKQEKESKKDGDVEGGSDDDQE